MSVSSFDIIVITQLVTLFINNFTYLNKKQFVILILKINDFI